VQQTVLASGLVLLVSEEHTLPVVTLKLLLDAGSREIPPGKKAWRVSQRTGSSSARREFSRDVQRGTGRHGRISRCRAGRDYITLSLQVVAKDLDHGFNLFMEAITQPTFPDKELRKEVQQTLAAIQAAESNPKRWPKGLRSGALSEEPLCAPGGRNRESLPRLSARMCADSTGPLSTQRRRSRRRGGCDPDSCRAS